MLNLAIDLDGTLAHWRSEHAETRLEGGDFLVGDWIDGAREALDAFLAAGFKVVIQSCRATWLAGGGLPAIAAFLRSGGFEPFAVRSVDEGGGQVEFWYPVLEDGSVRNGSLPTYVNERGWKVPDIPPNGVGIWVGEGKPIAHYYIDDRAVAFSAEAGWGPVVAGLGIAVLA